MKKIKLFAFSSVALFAVFSSFYILKHNFFSDKKVKNPAKPYDFFAESRAYPDNMFDLKAFEAVRSEAMLQNQNFRSASPILWQQEGPHNIGGRITCMAVSPTNSNVIFIGTPGAGIYKSTNGGTSWTAVFDSQSSLYIGSIAIDPNNTNIIYAGTGDPAIPFTVFVGDGIYKSTDGGNTWTNIGLANSKIISKIIVSPNNSNEIYVSANGNPIIADNNRGVYKSTNGGLTWSQVLFINNQTGVSDIVMNPNNNNEVYATSYTCIRNATVNIRYSNAARVYKTINGGASWNILLNGLPNTKINRYSICMSKQNTNKLYVAVSDSTYNMAGVYVTTNGGTSFTNMGNNGISGNYGGFGWYFSEIEVSPTNDNDVYIGGIELYKSTDGGSSWNINMPPWWNYIVHADIHCINFVSTGKYYLGTDGGTYLTSDDGANYTDVDDIPNTQFYRVEYNPHEPNNYFGGTQDNGTIKGNNTTISNWIRIYGGDGFQPRFDPTDPNTFYAETQNGGLVATTDGGLSFNANDNNINFSDRRNWDMPYVLNKFNPNTQYSGTYRVYKNTNGPSDNWTPISPDLTDGIILEPRFHNISAIDNSDLSAQKIYVGTSDANVWVTQNDGGSWTNITGNLPNRYVTSIHASPNVSNNVYVTHTGYKYNSYIPHIHKSSNNGTTWTDISGNLPQAGINDVLIYPGNENILFVANDIGVYVTYDAGFNWNRLGTNMPIIPVFDIAYNSSTQKLIAGTYAKSLQTIDVTSIITNVGSNTRHKKEIAQIYPSIITNSTFFVELNSLNQKNSLQIYGSNGQVIREEKEINAIKTVVDISELAKGLYFVEIKSGKEITLKKIIKN
jgi:photosystem II stability/assembly factor-like uncharacterized protein